MIELASGDTWVMLDPARGVVIAIDRNLLDSDRFVVGAVVFVVILFVLWKKRSSNVSWFGLARIANSW